MRYVACFLFLVFLLGAAKAQAAACPWSGSPVTVNSQAISAGDYDCSTQDITIAAGQTLTLQGNTGTNSGVILRAQNLTVLGAISANSQGFGAASGPGAGTTGTYDGSGAGHGGAGSIDQKNDPGGGTYGSILQPAVLGSGGGSEVLQSLSGGAGGGAIKLVVTGTLDVSGTLSANGANGATLLYGAGGGSGGSIWVEAGTLSGSGTISARGGGSGGTEKGGNGGGGRIALYYVTKTFNGTLSAAAGTGGWAAAGVGTVFESANGVLACSTGSMSVTGAELSSFTGINVSGGCNLTVNGSASLSGSISVGDGVASTLSITGSILAAAITVSSSSSMHIYSDVTAQSLGVTGSGSTLYVHGNTGTGLGSIMTLPSVTIGTGAKISADGLGYGAGSGPGAGITTIYDGSGAGHGGVGSRDQNGNAGGGTYGSLLQPTTLGSGGGSGTTQSLSGGSGGGAIKLVVSGTLDVSGTLSANGGNGAYLLYGAGGGAGGSIWVEAGTLAGSGTILATGGGSNGTEKGGNGGGGRIALYYGSKTFNGTVSAAAGTGGYAAAGVGTAFESTAGVLSCSVGAMAITGAELSSFSAVNVSGGCNLTASGSATLSGNVAIGGGVASTLSITGSLSAANVVIDSGSSMHIYSDLTAQSLSITGSGSSLYAHGNTGNNTGSVITASTVNIDTNAKISANALGFGSGAGPGAGITTIYDGSGAGHGGVGSVDQNGNAGGGTYDSLTQPTMLGSGGGSDTSQSLAGGAGGGAVKLVVSDTLTVSGTLSANAANGACLLYGAGGGAGGSIWIDAGTLAGSGSLSATGGGSCGTEKGGNGGGGRIALYYATKTFNGTVSVAAGTGGYAAAGVGTLYERRIGKYYSPVMDFSSSAIAFDTIVFSKTTPGTTSVSVDVRGGNTNSPDGTWTGWSTDFASGGSLAVFNGNRYLQYRVVLGSSDTNKPSLDSITINAPACYSTGSYYYLTTTSANRFQSARSNTATNVSITNSVPANTALKALVSFDGGTTWKKHNGSNWVDASGGVSTVGTMGNTAAELVSGLSNYTFGSSEPTLDFAFGLETDSCSATPSVTEVRFDY